jgi:hypothetical protein
VSYPNSKPPRVATNVNPVTNEALFCLMVYSPAQHKFRVIQPASIQVMVALAEGRGQ